MCIPLRCIQASLPLLLLLLCCCSLTGNYAAPRRTGNGSNGGTAGRGGAEGSKGEAGGSAGSGGSSSGNSSSGGLLVPNNHESRYREVVVDWRLFLLLCRFLCLLRHPPALSSHPGHLPGAAAAFDPAGWCRC